MEDNSTFKKAFSSWRIVLAIALGLGIASWMAALIMPTGQNSFRRWKVATASKK